MKSSSESKETKKPKKSNNSQKKIFIIIAILTLVVVIGYFQKQSTQDTKTEEPQIEEPISEQQQCTEMWLCQDANTKAYRRSDCTFEQITSCPAGCENAECKEEIIEEPQIEEPTEEINEEETEECTIGYNCLDEKRRGYQLSDCTFNNVDECEYGCKDGKCIKDAPLKEETEEEAFTSSEGKNTTDMPGWRFFDFSKKELFNKELNDYDVKLKLYASASSYNYYRAESYRSDIWLIEKGVTDATRSDCMDGMKDVNSYHRLRTGQTLCIETKEKNIALIGAYWEGLPKESTELTWKYYIPK